jgi:hypothetical protein
VWARARDRVLRRTPSRRGGRGLARRALGAHVVRRAQRAPREARGAPRAPVTAAPHLHFLLELPHPRRQLLVLVRGAVLGGHCDETPSDGQTMPTNLSTNKVGAGKRGAAALKEGGGWCTPQPAGGPRGG